MNKSVQERIITIIAIAIMIASHFMPGFGGLSGEAVSILGIFLGSLILWIFVSIDWPSLLTIIAIGFVPTFGFKSTFTGAFGNSTVAFLIFTFALVYPLSKTNFVKRCTIFFITNSIAKKGPWFFVCFVFAAVTFLGLFISPSVLFVAFLPFLENIIEVLGLKKGGKTANMLTAGSAICVNLSSGMTAIGHVWPTMAMGYYKAATGVDVNQFQYMAFGIPCGILVLILLILAYKFLYRPDDINDIIPEKAMKLKGTIPAASKKEKIILGTMALTVFLWVGPSLLQKLLPSFYSTINSYTTAFPPLLGCIILFLAKVDGERILNFKEVTGKGILWGSIIMTAAATVLGSGLTNSDIGISAWLSTTLQPVASNLNVTLMTMFFMAWAIIETNFSSNIVTTTVVSAVALSVLTAMPAGTVSVGAVVCMVGFAAGICSMTPAGQSTVNTVAIGSGYTDTKSMFIWGLVTAVSSLLVLTFIGYPILAGLLG